MTLGERIYVMRAERNLSQIDLAEELDVSRQSVSKWETDASVPELDKLVRMCELFDVSMDELVRGETGRQKSAPEYAASDIQRKERSKAPIIVGIILLCLTALMILPVLALLSTTYWVGALSAWFAILTAGIVCLSVKRHVALWTLWGVAFVYSLVGTVCNVIVQVRLMDLFPLSALIPAFLDVGLEILVLAVTVWLLKTKK